MRISLCSTTIALCFGKRSVSAFTPSTSCKALTFVSSTSQSLVPTGCSFNRPLQQLQMSSSSSSSPPQITSIDKAQMNEIIQIVEEESEEGESSYVIIDVRNVDEINYTGKLSPVVQTLPLPYIVQNGVFNMGGEDFEDQFGFVKPDLDKTVVFSCKAGIRSMHAAQFAIQAGYTNVVNYMGGADEWFR